jgi:ATP-dependent Clp protease ATP-binding subunit ClpX
LKAQEIFEAISREINGNEEASKRISAILAKHLRAPHSSAQQGHTLVIGPTGSGKSQLFSAIGSAVRVPIAHVDATTLTAVGYKGRDVDDIFLELYERAGHDIATAERGIVLIDEFDKIRDVSDEHYIGGRAVQHALLGALSGSSRQIQVRRRGREGESNDTVAFSTQRILFILAGSFNDSGVAAPADDIDPLSLERLGFSRELLARIENVIPMRYLTERDWAANIDEIIGKSVADYRQHFSRLGLQLTFSDAVKERVAAMCLSRPAGYRSVRFILAPAMLRAFYEADDPSTSGQLLRFDLDADGDVVFAFEGELEHV